MHGTSGFERQCASIGSAGRGVKRDGQKIAPGMFNSRERLRTNKEARHLRLVPENGIKAFMNKRHRATLAQIFAKPVSGSIKWADIEALLAVLCGEISERQGSRIGVYLFGEVRVFHRPHPLPDTNKGAVASIKKWFESHGVKP